MSITIHILDDLLEYLLNTNDGSAGLEYGIIAPGILEEAEADPTFDVDRGEDEAVVMLTDAGIKQLEAAAAGFATILKYPALINWRKNGAASKSL